MKALKHDVNSILNNCKCHGWDIPFRLLQKKKKKLHGSQLPGETRPRTRGLVSAAGGNAYMGPPTEALREGEQEKGGGAAF